MSVYAKSAAVAAAIAVMAAPAFAADPPAGTPDQDNPGAVHKPDSTPPSNDETGHKPDSTRRPTTGPSTSPTRLAPRRVCRPRPRPTGRLCKDQSKKHLEGEKGTPFSRCVSQGAKLLREHDDDD